MCYLKVWIGLLVRSSATGAPHLRSQPGPTVDAIDNIGTKVELLHYCHSHNIKVRPQDGPLGVAAR